MVEGSSISAFGLDAESARKAHTHNSYTATHSLSVCRMVRGISDDKSEGEDCKKLENSERRKGVKGEGEGEIGTGRRKER